MGGFGERVSPIRQEDLGSIVSFPIGVLGAAFEKYDFNAIKA